MDHIPLLEIASADVYRESAKDAHPGADESEHQAVDAQSCPLLVISTIQSGYNSGRKYIYRLNGPREAYEWQEELNGLIKIAQARAEMQKFGCDDGRKDQQGNLRARAFAVYNSKAFQVSVVILIALGCGLDLSEVVFCSPRTVFLAVSITIQITSRVARNTTRFCQILESREGIREPSSKIYMDILFIGIHTLFSSKTHDSTPRHFAICTCPCNTEQR